MELDLCGTNAYHLRVVGGLNFLSVGTSFAAQPEDAKPAGPEPASSFALKLDAQSGFITSLRRVGDTESVEFVRRGATLGPVKIRARAARGEWRAIDRGDLGIDWDVAFTPTDGSLIWSVALKNSGAEPIEIGDLELPLPMNADYTWDREETFNRRVFKHALIAGHGSFLYWLPVSGTGPILVIQPRQGTHLEYFDSPKSSYADGGESYSVFVHSRATEDKSRLSNWRQPRTSKTLQPGESAEYSFAFNWADDYDDVRRILFENGGVDLTVAPGLVVPRDLIARIAIRSKRSVRSVAAEYAQDTTIEERVVDPSTTILTTKFKWLGENRLVVTFDGGATMPIEFFVTLPLETLIKKRAAFIASKQQHRDPSKWYDGLFSLWDTRLSPSQNLLGPDNRGGQDVYAVSGSDDPCNGKALYLAEKNIAFPDPSEIQAVEYYLDRFVWGKLQRTDKETPFPFGIYGSESWHENRFADRDPMTEATSRPGGPSACRMWRSYDYTTMFALYFDMYRIAKHYPTLMRYGDAATYLDRAFGTARAYFTVPANIYMDGGWTHKGWVYWQYTTGNFHEKYLLPLIDALESEGRADDASFLRREWEKKVKYMIYDDPIPFVSEMPVDSTAYESTYTVAKYALSHRLAPDVDLWRDRNENRSYSHPTIEPARHAEFMERQHAANLACRGVLETNYWSLGSDFRGCGSAHYTLSYMSQMGGWAVLDYALRHDASPPQNLRLGFASMLSSWALMNAGDEESHYGYWAPGTEHNGAVGWGFQPESIADGWNFATKGLVRGAWPVCGEIDHGLVAAVEGARTVVYDDPLFGTIALGGELMVDGDKLQLRPRDGVRQRISLLLDGRRTHIELSQDGFAMEHAVVLDRDLSEIEFCIENRGTRSHVTTLRFEGLDSGRYEVKSAGASRELRVAQDGKARFDLNVTASTRNVVRISRVDEDAGR